MTRDELIGDIKKGIEEVFPENVDLDEDDITTVENAVEQVLENADAALEEDDEDEVAEKAPN